MNSSKLPSTSGSTKKRIFAEVTSSDINLMKQPKLAKNNTEKQILYVAKIFNDFLCLKGLEYDNITKDDIIKAMIFL